MKMKKQGIAIVLWLVACLHVGLQANVKLTKIDGNISEKPMVVIIPSYENEQFAEKNLSSVFNQKYENYRVLYIDDCSKDNTYNKVQQIVKQFKQSNRTNIIHNNENRGAMANWYTSIHSCDDDEIIIQLDGDDWLENDQVLAYINNVYSDPNIWMTYGQFREFPSNIIGYEYSLPFSHAVITSNSFRKVGQLPISHLRTCYAWLFKSIPLENFLYEGSFYPMTCDKVMCACLIERAGSHHYCVPDVLYVYNNRNPLNDHRINLQRQHTLAWYILSQKALKPLGEQVSCEELGEWDHVVRIGFYVDSQPLRPSLLDYLKSIRANFILLEREGSSNASCVNESLSIKMLKKTAVDIMLCEPIAKLNELDVIKKLPRVSIEYHVYAWKFAQFATTYNVKSLNKIIMNRDLAILAFSEGFKQDSNNLFDDLVKWIEKENKLVLGWVLE